MGPVGWGICLASRRFCPTRVLAAGATFFAAVTAREFKLLKQRALEVLYLRGETGASRAEHDGQFEADGRVSALEADNAPYSGLRLSVPENLR